MLYVGLMYLIQHYVSKEQVWSFHFYCLQKNYLHEKSSISESIEKSGLRILDTLFEVFAEKNMLAVNAFFVFSTLLFDNIAFNSIISKNSSNKFQKCCIYSQISKNIGAKLLRLLLHTYRYTFGVYPTLYIYIKKIL